jgi:hypothetical protein
MPVSRFFSQWSYQASASTCRLSHGHCSDPRGVIDGKKMADQIRREGYEYWELRYDPAANTVRQTKKF